MTGDEVDKPFEARVIAREGVVVVVLRGEADLRAAEAIDAAFDAAAKHPGPLVADLTELLFLDSSGLRAVIQAHSRIVSQGRRFGLAADPDGAVGKVLALTQLHRLMPVHPDRETAARALRG
ncbi:MAG: anti-sigma factor antagonist [Solirubrobacterales bacterium]|jgi:anti-anti-sigma factor|nr:anti-sigma factor antagonist [Solirubrobacterales bacterium]